MQELYSTEFLVKRIENSLKNQKTKQFKLIKPKVKPQHKKTFIFNFEEICACMNRNISDVKQYLETELKISSSINETGNLILNNRYQIQQIEGLVAKYAYEFVKCSACGSGDTKMEKEGRIKFLVCNKCFQKKAIE